MPPLCAQLSLFTGDLVQAVGALLQIRWIDAGKVQVGSFCTVQGDSSLEEM
jgi:hypothetical protein